jgi:PPM family protein phosphatase
MDGGVNFGLLSGLCPAAPSGALAQALCFAATWEVPILLLVVVAAVGSGFFRHRRTQDAVRDMGPGMLVFPTGGARPPMPSVPAPRPATPPPPAEPTPHRASPAPEAPFPRPASAPAPAMPSASPSPEEGTLQLLPGRLEFSDGPRAGEEIRFVRLPGSEPEITLGRAEGEAFRHVRLDSPTVSRQHARLRFIDGGWVLRNESATNPTRVNDRTLSSGVESARLADGDRLEIGEVALIFRQEGGVDRLPFRSSWNTDQGRRPTNQDAVVVRSLPGGRELAAVCDGMGSHRAGGLASHRALDALIEHLSGGGDLLDAVQFANRAVLQAATESEERVGMATTLVAMLRDGDRYSIANVGDSRAYRMDADGLHQLTTDHSFMAEAVQDGKMSEEEAARSPFRNAITRSLGAGPELEVDLLSDLDATAPHLVILCSDGVHGVLGKARMTEVILATPSVRDLARALSERALVAGGEDNVAVAVMELGGGIRPPGSS